MNRFYLHLYLDSDLKYSPLPLVLWTPSSQHCSVPHTIGVRALIRLVNSKLNMKQTVQVTPDIDIDTDTDNDNDTISDPNTDTDVM